MKKITLSILALYVSLFNCYGQDWRPYNDTLVYFYSASNTGDYFTLRTKLITVLGEETKIHFADNYIPCDTTLGPEGTSLYYAQNGSVLGDSLVIVNDTTWFDSFRRFVNTMSIGETLLYSSFDGTEITYLGSSDTILFDIPDSVKYYAISDGSQLIQSKSFGFIQYPKPHIDSTITYELVGIENYVGMSFDHHNEIFDFEVGDKFYYSNSFYSVFYEIWDANYSKMEVLNKYVIDGKYYYDVRIDGYLYSNYPELDFGNTSYDYPGEQVQFCRACDGISSLPFTYLISGENEYLRNIGHSYVESPETGNIIQVVGYGKIKDTYTTFGVGNKVVLNSVKQYEFYPYDEDELLNIEGFDGYEVISEEGFGMVYFNASIGEMGHYRHLIGAIKSGDTLGIVNASLYEDQMIRLNLFPNPATDLVYLGEELSSITIVDMMGKQIMYFEKSMSQIDISELETGTYIIYGTNLFGDLKLARFSKI